MKDLITLITQRKSARRFIKKPVDHDLVNRIIDIARQCATGGNMQPWHIDIVTGKTKQKLSDALKEAIYQGQQANPDYNYYPPNFFDPFTLRRHHSGLALYHAENIQFSTEHIDWEGVAKLAVRNYDFFGADIGFIFYIDKRLTSGAHIDIGIFMQNIMLLAEYFGLRTCSQAALGNYPDIVRSILSISDDMKILCGMSLGYADENAKINQCKIPKETIDTFSIWHK